ncbi:MAG TPA: 2-C-methyl-D-erythritol 4-phosphate cytidylyltransferase [Acidimicrobiales bacterium]|nr:2-C-methyl-D-erythritol 4-phosphate cytidylyltransferase [Acidimicrobiales bacterium]
MLAAGGGSRFGGPKQFEPLAGRRVVDWSLDAARSVADHVVLVLPAGRAEGDWPGADDVVPGGATRSDSARAGLAVVDADAEVVVIHDAARPLARPELFAAVVSALGRGADGALPGVAVPDTVKEVAGDRVVATLDRAHLVLVQTPQAFRADWLRRAHAAGGQATDDAALVEAAGGRVVVVEGDPRNVKITHPDDLVVAEALLGRR